MSDQGISILEIDPTLDALTEFEKNHIEKDIEPRHFTIRNTWMANDAGRRKNLLHLLSFTRPPVPGLFRKTLAALFLKRLSKPGTYRPLASIADFLQLKLDGTRLRAFYIPGGHYKNGLCVKIIPKKSDLAQRTMQENAFRQKLTELNAITVPKILEISEDNQFLYISEEFISGQRYRNLWHQHLYASQGVRELCAMYKSFPYHFETASQHIPKNLVQDARKHLSSSKIETEFLTALDKAVTADPQIPIGTCHHDLLPSNLCVSGGRLYFFDWEMVSEGSILSDLLKLPFKYTVSKQSIKSVSEVLKSEFPTENGDYLDQFTIYVAERIQINPKKKAKFLKHWQQCQHMFAN